MEYGANYTTQQTTKRNGHPQSGWHDMGRRSHTMYGFLSWDSSENKCTRGRWEGKGLQPLPCISIFNIKFQQKITHQQDFSSKYKYTAQ